MNARLACLLALSSLFLASCGTFERDWKRSLAEYRSGSVASPAGPWEGTWTTATNGHTGKLRAIVRPSDKEPGTYDFRYHATYMKILSGGYRVRFPGKRSGGAWRFDGEQKLGIFGTFGHKATITRDSFKATYSNDKGDLGKFEMGRP